VILTGVSFVVAAVVGLALGSIAVGFILGNTPRLFYFLLASSNHVRL
jgi:hypothetical protein